MSHKILKPVKSIKYNKYLNVLESKPRIGNTIWLDDKNINDVHNFKGVLVRGDLGKISFIIDGDCWSDVFIQIEKLIGSPTEIRYVDVGIPTNKKEPLVLNVYTEAEAVRIICGFLGEWDYKLENEVDVCFYEDHNLGYRPIISLFDYPGEITVTGKKWIHVYASIDALLKYAKVGDDIFIEHILLATDDSRTQPVFHVLLGS